MEILFSLVSAFLIMQLIATCIFLCMSANAGACVKVLCNNVDKLLGSLS